MNTTHRLIGACAILIAALTLLVPLSEIESDDCYGDKSVADTSPVLGEEENQPVGPLTVYYSLDNGEWTPIPIMDVYLKYIADVVSPLNLNESSSLRMKVEANPGYTFDQNPEDESLIKITTLSVSWKYSLSDEYDTIYEITSVNTNTTEWIVPVDTLGPFDLNEYLDFTVCCTAETDNTKIFPCYYLNNLFDVDPRHEIPNISSILGHYECGDQSFDIYKSGDTYRASIKGDSNESAVENIFYYYVSSNGEVTGPAFSIGHQINAYMTPVYDDSGNVISLKCTDLTDPKYGNEMYHGYITEGNVFTRSYVLINETLYDDIYAAVETATDRDEILIFGNYELSESLIINKEITLKGVIGDAKEYLTKITGFQGSSDVSPVVNIRIESSATLDSIWINIDPNTIGANGDNCKGMRGAIDLGDSANAKVVNCKFTKATPNQASDQSTAVYGGSGSLIENNYFSGWPKAVYTEIGTNLQESTIRNNIIENSSYGIHISATSNYSIFNNNISNCGIAISGDNIRFEGYELHDVVLKIHTSDISIHKNAFIGSSEVINKKPSNGLLDVSRNYWEGTPEISGNLKLNNWYRSYNSVDSSFSELVNETIIGIIYVNGSVETSGNGSKDFPFKTISEAIEVVNAGQTISVLPGTYDEVLSISKGLDNVTLLGVNSDNNPLNDSWNPNGTILLKGINIETRGTHEDPNPNIVDGLTIKGFDFKNKGFVVEEWWENGSISNVAIENNRFIDINDGSNSAIHFNTSPQMAVDNLTIKYNLIENVGSHETSPSGISISSAKGTVLIEGNWIENTNHSSIQVFNQSSGELIIQNNHLENWDSDAFNGGRTFRFDSISIDEITIYLNSIIQKSDFNGADLKDMYLKITNSETFIEASGNYWDGKDPTVEGFPISANDECIVVVHSWYTQYDPENNELGGLETDDIPGVLPDVPDVPIFPDVPTVPEVPTPDENGDVSIEIPKKDIDKIVDDAISSGSGSVTITDVSNIENVSSVTISKENLQNILDKMDAEDSISDAVIKLPEGSVSIGKDVLSSILETAEEKSITVKVSDAKDALNEEQQKIVGDRPVYDITMLRGSEKVTSFNGRTITVSIPYELKENESPDNIVVYYVKDDGTIEKMNCVYKDGKVSFETNHLSYFAISYEEPEPVPEEPAGNDGNNTIYYAIAVILVLIIIVAAAYIIKRKQ